MVTYYRPDSIIYTDHTSSHKVKVSQDSIHQIIKSKVSINRMNLIYDALLPLVLSGRIEEKKRVFPKTETE